MSITEDSLLVAFEMAQGISLALQTQKETKNIEKIEEYSVNGILHLDDTGRILLSNKTMEHLLMVAEHTLQNRNIWDVFKEITKEELEKFASGKEDTRSYLIKYKQKFLYFTLAKLDINRQGAGFLLSGIQREKTGEVVSKEIRRVNVRFEDISCISKEMRKCVEQARMYAISSAPVFLVGAIGIEMYEIAAAIHNSSVFQDFSFLAFSGRNFSRAIFLEHREMFDKIKKASIFIDGLEHLSKESQSFLLDILRRYPRH